MLEITLCNNLEKLMRIHGNLSVSDLARLSSVPQPTLHHILSGATKKPRRRALELLAKFFSISIEQLMGGSPLPQVIPEAIKENLSIKTIPIIEWTQVRKWPAIIDECNYTKEIILEKKVDHYSFALIMQDTSMEPTFPKDSILVFDPAKAPKDRDFIIVHLTQSDEIVFNRLFIDGNELCIKKVLPDKEGNIQLIKLKRTDKIIAALTEVRVQY